MMYSIWCYPAHRLSSRGWGEKTRAERKGTQQRGGRKRRGEKKPSPLDGDYCMSLAVCTERIFLDRAFPHTGLATDNLFGVDTPTLESSQHVY